MKNIAIFFLLLVLLPLFRADIISINAGGDRDLIINTDDYIEGFFNWVDVDITGITWSIEEGGGVLNILFSNYTLTKSRRWVINEQGKVIINCYDVNKRPIDVHNIKVIFNDKYIKEANLTRLDVGEYSITFDIGNRVGRTKLFFNVDDKKQTLTINIIEPPFNIFIFLKEHLWIPISAGLLLLISVLILIIAWEREEKEKKE